jgi:hypothetical protein
MKEIFSWSPLKRRPLKDFCVVHSESTKLDVRVEIHIECFGSPLDVVSIDSRCKTQVLEFLADA